MRAAAFSSSAATASSGAFASGSARGSRAPPPPASRKLPGLAAALGDAVGKRGGEQPPGIAVGAAHRRAAAAAGDTGRRRGGCATARRGRPPDRRRRSPPGAGRYPPARPGRAADRAPPAARRDRRRARPRPAFRAASIIAASRGCAPSAAMRRPGVGDAALRRRARQARVSSAVAAAKRAGRRRVEERQIGRRRCPRRRSRVPGPTAPPPGSPAGRAAASPRCSAVDHSRIATPGASRPARPARCSAAAREMRSVASRVRPVAGSSRGARRQPPSTTIRTPGTVSEVSAIEVASTTRRPSAGRSARSCSAGGRSPCSGSTSAPQPSSAAWVRRISAMPGRKAEDVAVMLPPARHARRGPSLRAARAGRGCRARRGGSRPGTCGRRSRSPPRPAVRRGGAPSAVADMASSRSSGRSTRCRSRHSASARSDSSERSCTSSRITAATPSSAGIGLQPADQQALGDDLDARRRRDGGVQPGAVADRAADRLAEQRRHAGGGGAGGQPARLQHQDACRRRATAHRAARAAPAWSCRRPAAPTARRCARPRARRAAAGWHRLTGSSGSMLAIRRIFAICARKLRFGNTHSGTSWHARLRMPTRSGTACWPLLLLVIGWLGPAVALESAPVASARATASLVSDTDTVAPGQPFRVGAVAAAGTGLAHLLAEPRRCRRRAGAGSRPAARRHGRTDRVAGAAARRRGCADDLRLHRRRAAAGHRHALGRRETPP